MTTTWTWIGVGGVGNWSDPYWVQSNGTTYGTPSPGDVVHIAQNGLTIDSQTITNTIFQGPGNNAVVEQDTTFAVGTTISATGAPSSSGWSNSVYGDLLNDGVINDGNATTAAEVGFGMARNTIFTTPGVFTNEGTINAINSEFQVDSLGPTSVTGAFINDGVIDVTYTGVGNSDLFDDMENPGAQFVNDGTIIASAGSAGLPTNAFAFIGGGSVSGTGTIELTNGELAVFQGGAVGSDQTVIFENGSGLVKLGTGVLTANAFQASMENFQLGDTVDLGTVATSAFPSGTGQVTIKDGVSDIGTLNLTEAVGTNLYSIVQNGPSDSLLVVSAACFAAGAHILTVAGEVPIEAVRPGDRVCTRTGLAAVAWTGHRRVAPGDAGPVRIAAHAFGPGQPHRPLQLSPDHAVFVDGTLIPVHMLVNGASVAWQPGGFMTYWHLELTRHDIVLAEGLKAETYLDTGNRAAFDAEEDAQWPTLAISNG